MENGKPIEIEIGGLIALCYILDDYKKFSKDLSTLLSSKSYTSFRKILHQLIDVSTGKSILGAKKVKDFYQENKAVIDTINKYYYISDFILLNCNSKGVLFETSSWEFFYQYLSNHKEELPTILSMLHKLKDLGFKRLEFDENADFTQEEYKMATYFNQNDNIIYFDNIQVIPSYQIDIVRYKTTNSSYKITLDILSKISEEFSAYNRKIVVNTLLFALERLPKAITKETIFDTIIYLKEEQKEQCVAIQNAVNLSVNVDKLYALFNSSNDIIQKLSDSIENKEELREVLASIKEGLDKLQTISTNYNESISQKDSLITQEKLQEEKEMYLARKHNSSIDGC